MLEQNTLGVLVSSDGKRCTCIYNKSIEDVLLVAKEENYSIVEYSVFDLSGLEIKITLS